MKADESKFDASGRLKNGEFKEFFKDGTLASVGHFRDGERVGEWKFYLKNGVLRAVGQFVDGKLSGEWKWYRENGNLMQTGSFVEERESGTCFMPFPTHFHEQAQGITWDPTPQAHADMEYPARIIIRFAAEIKPIASCCDRVSGIS